MTDIGPSDVKDMTREQLAVMLQAVEFIDASLLDAYLDWASGIRLFYGSTNLSLTAYWIERMGPHWNGNQAA